MNRIRASFFSILSLCCIAGGNLLTADADAHKPTIESTSTIIELNQENSKKTLDSAHFLVIDVYADWCGPCKRLKPIFNELNTEYGKLYQFAKVNADSNDAFVERFQITGFPTILFIKDGKEVGRIVGFLKKEQLAEALKKHFNN